MKEITNKSEKLFAEYLESIGAQYIYQPKVIILRGIGYTPDFFVLENNCYYEVVGTRQAFSQNRIKINLAQSLVNLFIVNPNGTPYKFNKYISYRRGKTNVDLTYCNIDLAGFLHKESIPPKVFAIHCGVASETVTRMVRNEKINLKYLDKIAKKYPSILEFTWDYNQDIKEMNRLIKEIKAGEDNA